MAKQKKQSKTTKKEELYYPHFGSNVARFETEEDIEHLFRMFTHVSKPKNLKDFDRHLFGMNNTNFDKYMKSGQYNCTFERDDGYNIIFRDNAEIGIKLLFIYQNLNVYFKKHTEVDELVRMFGKQSFASEEKLTNSDLVLSKVFINHGVKAIDNIFESILTKEYAENTLIPLIKSASTSPNKYHGQHIECFGRKNIPLIFPYAENDESQRIDSSMIEPDMSELITVNGPHTKIIRSLFSKIKNAGSNKSSFMMDNLVRVNMASSSNSETKMVLSMMKEAIESIPTHQAPESVICGTKNILVPDGDGGYISLTPTPLPSLMSSMQNKWKSIEENINAEKKDTELKSYSPLRNIISRKIFDGNESKNAHGSHYGMMYAFNQMPFFYPKKTFKERKEFIISMQIKNGVYDINEHMFKDRSFEYLCHIIKGYYGAIVKTPSIESTLLSQLNDQKTVNKYIQKFLKNNVEIIDVNNIENEQSSLLKAVKYGKREDKLKVSDLIKYHVMAGINRVVGVEIHARLKSEIDKAIEQEIMKSL